VRDDTCFTGVTGSFGAKVLPNATGVAGTAVACRKACRESPSCSHFTTAGGACNFLAGVCTTANCSFPNIDAVEKIPRCGERSACIKIVYPGRWDMAGEYCPMGDNGAQGPVYRRTGTTKEDIYYFAKYEPARDGEATWAPTEAPTVAPTETPTAAPTLACVDLTGTYKDSTGTVAILTQTNCTGTVRSAADHAVAWTFTVAGIVATATTGGLTGTITPADNIITISWSNGVTYTTLACVDLTGTYKDSTGTAAILTQTNCAGTARTAGHDAVAWTFTVEGNVTTATTGSLTGTITQADNIITISWSNGVTYTTCVDLT